MVLKQCRKVARKLELQRLACGRWRHADALDQIPHKCNRLVRRRVTLPECCPNVGDLGAIAARGLRVQRDHVTRRPVRDDRRDCPAFGLKLVILRGGIPDA